MGFRLPKSNVPLLVVAMGAMVLSATAQQSGQPIIFSAPQNDDVQSTAPSLATQNSRTPVLPDALQAPVSIFQIQATPNIRQPAPQMDSAGQQQMKKLLDARKNWALMTPEEIFGVTTSEKLLKPPERDAMGREKSQTPLERYLDRESQLRTGHTNDLQNDRTDSPWNVSRDRNDANPFDSIPRGADDPAQNLNRFLNGQRIGDVSANQNGNVTWDSFNTAAQQTTEKPDLEQMAAMARFRQLLEPNQVSAAPSPDSGFFPAPKSVLDPNITQPDFVPNPAGASFTPLTSGIGKPAGLSALPGIVSTAPQTVATPAWAPQPPPWLLQGPQPFTMPQRKF
jgi:hypothetical protein